MKIYVVTGDDNDSYRWIDGVFSSRESAEKHVRSQIEKFAKKKARYDELCGLARELTEDEARERFVLFNVTETGRSYNVKEYEVQE